MYDDYTGADRRRPPAVREGLAARISCQPDLEVCGEVADMAGALKLLVSARPHVAVVDIKLKVGDGLDLVKRMKAHDELIRILVWSVYPDQYYAPRALEAGALGYINKDRSTNCIVEAIRRVRDGKVYLSEELAERDPPPALRSSPFRIASWRCSG